MKLGDRVEFVKTPGTHGTIMGGPYTYEPWGAPDAPTFLVRGDNGYEGYRSPDVLALTEEERSSLKCPRCGDSGYLPRAVAEVRLSERVPCPCCNREGADDLCSPECAHGASHCGDGHCIDRDGPL